MKTINYLIMLIITLSSIVACKPEVNVTATEKVQNELLEVLQGTWATAEARKDNTVITDFSDFKLTISDKGYTTENGSPVWPSSGTFDFASPEIEDEFLRQDGRLFTASENNGRVNITIIYTEENGRGEFGTYEFVLE